MAHPRVSVVMPTFNRLTWLPISVRSVQDQTMPDWELVLVDDGSTDGTENWVRLLAEPRLKLLRQAHTGSIAAGRNAGISHASGEWIAFLDSDDRWWPDKLNRQLAQIHQSREAGWCYSKYQLVNALGEAVPQPSGSSWYPYSGWFVDRVLTTEASVITQTLLVRRDLTMALRFDERIPLVDDYDFVLRLAATSPGVVVDDILADVRIHEARTTTVAGPFDGYFGKIVAYRKASRAMPDEHLRLIARAQFRSHLRTFLRRAARHGAVGQLVRVARMLRQL